MPRFDDDRPQGVIPACLLPFKEDLGIDEAAYRQAGPPSFFISAGLHFADVERIDANRGG